MERRFEPWLIFCFDFQFLINMSFLPILKEICLWQISLRNLIHQFLSFLQRVLKNIFFLDIKRVKLIDNP